MKKYIKLISFTLLALLVLPAIIVAQETSTTAANSEKIASPAEIKNYEKIEKRGNALYGVKKKVNEVINEANKKMAEIKKEISEKVKENDGATKKMPIKENSTTIDSEISSCVISAVVIKDRGYIEQETLFSSAIVSLITKRGDCQQAALKSTDNQKENLNSCAKEFKEGRAVLQKNTDEARRQIQETYRASLKACVKTSSSSEVQQSEIVIDDGVGQGAAVKGDESEQPMIKNQDDQATSVSSDVISDTSTVASSTTTLEKITSPVEIKNYEKIEKRGNVLYGVKKKANEVIKRLYPNSQIKKEQK